MAAFRAQDAKHAYPHGGTVFVGSSSILGWDLKESFPTLDPPPLNRGFGGSHISDSIDHAELLVVKHKPRTIVMYAGDNDIAEGKSPERVRADFEEFAKRVRTALPDARLIYIAIKPSLARWKWAPAMEDANRRIRSLCEEDDRLTFVDIWAPMLGDDGRPRRELFADDGLHLNAAGYQLWRRALRGALPAPTESSRATDSDVSL